MVRVHVVAPDRPSWLPPALLRGYHGGAGVARGEARDARPPSDTPGLASPNDDWFSGRVPQPITNPQRRIQTLPTKRLPPRAAIRQAGDRFNFDSPRIAQPSVTRVSLRVPG
jgi:hypothetical protein